MISCIYIIYILYGKHLTGDRLLSLNLPFVFRDLIAPEVVFPSTRYHIMAYIMYDTCTASRAGCLVANLLWRAPAQLEQELQDQGGRDEEASRRGRCRSGGGARPEAAAELIEHWRDWPMMS